MEIELGSTVVERITGFVGVAISRTVYLNGCARIGVQSPVLNRGTPVPEQYFDEVDLEVVLKDKDKYFIEPEEKELGPGGTK